MSNAAARFHRSISAELRHRPFRTPRGLVRQERRETHFGTPSGSHDRTHCWVYSAHESPFELLFAFYENFSPHDLICKIVPSAESPAVGSGATLQFNGTESVVANGTELVLRHHGIVTVGARVARQVLLERLHDSAPQAIRALGGVQFPFICGSTSNTGALLDRLFLYAYAVEQAKRSLRGESPLLAMYPRGPFEGRASPEHNLSTGQGLLSSADARRAVELRAMEVAQAHLSGRWPDVRDVSAREPFDFLCVDGHQFLHVEVKGTTQDGSAILLTRNEVEHARTYAGSVALIVVSQIELTSSQDGTVTAVGGILRAIDPWDLVESRLGVLTYVYCVDEPLEETPA